MKIYGNVFAHSMMMHLRIQFEPPLKNGKSINAGIFNALVTPVDFDNESYGV